MYSIILLDYGEPPKIPGFAVNVLRRVASSRDCSALIFLVDLRSDDNLVRWCKGVNLKHEVKSARVSPPTMLFYFRKRSNRKLLAIALSLSLCNTQLHQHRDHHDKSSFLLFLARSRLAASSGVSPSRTSYHPVRATRFN